MTEALTTTAAFPELLRHHRIRAGLTQRALADLSTVSPRAIRDLEAGRANARTQTIHLLADGLRLQGSSRDLFVTACLSRRPTSPFDDCDTMPGQPVNSLQGRDAEVRTMMAVLESGHRRMISISGLAGVGKTRVTAELATRLSARHRWPVLWIGTDPRTLNGPGAANGALMRLLRSAIDSNAEDVSQVCQLVGRHDALLVLDGITEAKVPWGVEELLSSCPGLRVISTSRTPWHVTGVQAAVISPLDTPVPGCTLEELAEVASVRLLVDRLAEVRPGFALCRANAAAAGELCRRLDGLPLALEVVAGRSRVLSLQQLAEVPVPDLLELSAPARPGDAPATIGALIGASVDGLPAEHRTILRELAGRDRAWTVTEVAAALRQPLDEVVDGLDVLIGAGLLRACHDEPTTDLQVPNLLRAVLRRPSHSGCS